MFLAVARNGNLGSPAGQLYVLLSGQPKFWDFRKFFIFGSNKTLQMLMSFTFRIRECEVQRCTCS